MSPPAMATAPDGAPRPTISRRSSLGGDWTRGGSVKNILPLSPLPGTFPQLPESLAGKSKEGSPKSKLSFTATAPEHAPAPSGGAPGPAPA